MNDLIAKLNNGPKYLFIGQNILNLEVGEDLLLSSLCKKYDKTDECNSYLDFMTSLGDINREEFCNFALRQSHKIITTKTLNIIADFYWSGVVTTCFHEVVERSFIKPWREIQIIQRTQSQYNSPLNKQRMNFWYLYGSITVSARELEKESPPIGKFEYKQYKTQAITNFKWLLKQLTPLGNLLIESYSIDDMLDVESLCSLISELCDNQVHLFSCSKELLENEDIQYAIKTNKIVIYRESLSTFLEDAFQSGDLQLINNQEISFERSIEIDKKLISIPLRYWNEITSTATLITQNHYKNLKKIQEDTKYDKYRHFLYASSKTPVWEGYFYNFDYKRDFFKELEKKTLQSLQERNYRSKNLIILHGQTGSGKTIALGALAYTIQNQGKYPVIFIDQFLQKIKQNSIETFCKYLEEQGSENILIIWDNMSNIEEYIKLRDFLQGKGRKIVLVGSSYKRYEQSEHIKHIDFIEAKIELTLEEKARLEIYFSSIDKNLVNIYYKTKMDHHNNFLALLYRYLPVSRYNLQRGIYAEIEDAEHLVIKEFQKEQYTLDSDNVLARELLKVGLNTASYTLGYQEYKINDEFYTEFQVLVAYIMIPAQFGIECPLELIVRIMKKTRPEYIAKILSKVDVFRWSEDHVGNIMVSARTAIEAEILIKYQVGEIKEQIQYILKLINEINIFSEYEKYFLISLLHAIGPNGNLNDRYKNFYSKIADAIKNIRIQYEFSDANLLLQESQLYRNAARHEEDVETKNSFLAMSEDAAQTGIELTSASSDLNVLKSRFFVELAAAYGQRAKNSVSIDNKIELNNQIFNTCLEAYRYDSQNFYPFDVILWNANDILDNSLNEKQKYELFANILFTIELANSEDYNEVNINRLKERKSQIYERIGNDYLSDKYFNELIEQGSTIGIYTRYSFKSKDLFDKNKYDKNDQMKCEFLLNELTTYDYMHSSDYKIELLKFKLWWIWKTGEHFKYSVRQKLAMKDADWSLCRDKILCLIEYQELSNVIYLRYLLGLTYYQLNAISEGSKIFQELEMSSLGYKNRILIKNYLTNEDGTEKQFNGRVDSFDITKKKGYMHVNEFSKTIPFIISEAKKSDLSIGDSFTDLRLVFNMIGPLIEFRNE